MTSNTGDYSGDDSDNGVDEDLEAYRRVCILTGTNPDDLRPSTTATPSIPLPNDDNDDEDSESDSLEDDLEFVRGLRQRFSIDEEPQPLCTILPDECEDDFQLLRVIEQRFSQYNANSVSNSTGCSLQQHEQVGATNIDSEKESSNNLFVERTNNGEGFPDCVDASTNTQNLGFTSNNGLEEPPSDSVEWHEPGAEIVAVSPDRNSSFPISAQAFVDAIKKNRSCQKFIRMKMMQIETKMEENKKLRGRIKILKDFQVACRKRTGRALSRKKDARVQLISVPKLRVNAKVDEKNPSALYHGPAENSQVANYRMALQRFPLVLNRATWSKQEKENLPKGIKQQFQETLLQKSVDIFSEADRDSSDFDSMIVSIREHDITSEEIKLFLPKVNWEQVASMYVMGRTGAECESRWLNCEDPLINHNPWTKLEDKNLLHIVQQRGISNWIDIADSLGTNRTPFQCLARYQRSLNASILKREWNEDEDDKLRAAVAACGESNWQAVASAIEGRTGTQCSNRWMKSLNPMRQKVGRWSLDEDKRLKIAVMLFGAKNWHKIAQFIPGRTQVQCRERWVNCLDPSLITSKWTEEEDSKLRAAISEHGYTSWSKVAACLAPRTDSQCRRRWAALHPDEVYLSQATRKLQKEALISNFVDRESERPALGPGDFIPLAIGSIPGSKKLGRSRKKGKKKRRPVPEQSENEPPSGCVPTRRSSRLRKGSHKSSDEVLRLIDEDEVGDVDVSKKKRERRRSPSVNGKPAPSNHDLPLSCSDETPLPITNGEEGNVRRDKSKKKTATRKKMAPRVQKKKSGIREEPEEANTLSEVDDIPNPSRGKPCPRVPENSCPTSIEVAEFTVEEAQETNEFIEVEASSVDDDLFKYKRKKTKRRKKIVGTDPRQSDDIDVECSDIMKKSKSLEPYSCTTSPDLPDQNTRSETANREDDDAQDRDINEERPLRCSTPDIVDCLNPRLSSEPRPNRRKKSKDKDGAISNKKKNKKKTEDENDMTLASFLEQRGKHVKPVFRSPRLKLGAISDIVDCSQNLDLPPPTSDISENQDSDYEQTLMQSMQKHAKGGKRKVFQMSETKDEDDITLACWMSKLKERKLK